MVRMILRLNQTPEDHKMQLVSIYNPSRRVCRQTALVFSLVLLGLAGCASDTSFERHNLSRLWMSQDGKNLFFDATVSSRYPADNSVAEAARLEWMGEWLELRKFCPDGHQVVERRAIKDEEYNPMRHDLRYEVECLK